MVAQFRESNINSGEQQDVSLSAQIMNPHIPSTMKSLTCKLKLGPRCTVNPLSAAPQGVSGLIGEVSMSLGSQCLSLV